MVGFGGERVLLLKFCVFFFQREGGSGGWRALRCVALRRAWVGGLLVFTAVFQLPFFCLWLRGDCGLLCLFSRRQTGNRPTAAIDDGRLIFCLLVGFLLRNRRASRRKPARSGAEVSVSMRFVCLCFCGAWPCVAQLRRFRLPVARTKLETCRSTRNWLLRMLSGVFCMCSSSS